MIIIYIILLAGGVWLLWEIFVKGSPSKTIEKYEEFGETMLNSYRMTNKVSYGQETDPPDVVRMQDWYIRLKEKFKHDKAKLLQLAEDWKDYAYNLSSKNINFYLYLESENNEDGKERDKKAREARLKIEEIENRFAEMLDPQYRRDLEAERREKEAKAKAEWEALGTEESQA